MSCDPGDQTYYTWDHRNRLTHVSQFSGDHEVLVVDYGYDAFNQLVSIRTDKPFENGPASTVLAYDNGQVALEFDETGSDPLSGDDLSHRYLWGPAVDQLLTDENIWSLYDTIENETLWALADAQGTVRDLVDDAGRLRIHRAFDSFGNILDETHYNTDELEVNGPSSQFGYLDEAFAYTGRWFDQNTNLQTNTNRWYDPATGRWLSEDPIGFAAGDANLYRYVGNGATNGVDPPGLASPGPGYGALPSPFWPPPKPRGSGGEGSGGAAIAALPPSGCPINPDDLNNGNLRKYPQKDLEWYRDSTEKRIREYKERMRSPVKPGDAKNMQRNIDFQNNRLRHIEEELNKRCLPPISPKAPWWLRWGPPVWLYPEDTTPGFWRGRLPGDITA